MCRCKMPECTITVKKPARNLPAVLDKMFDRSCAISDAVSQFWGMKLAVEADLGEVKEYDDRYEVTIIY